MKPLSKTAILSTALLAVSVPAVAHVGDHSVASSSHWLVGHGLAIGGVAAIIALVATIYIIRKKA